ncbi:MAG TPA: MgtC/SapB family protein, partial [Candidatus Margulisiibacteriota bacterium]|nr:MgtC/SapB family protein [Candidatus Margulisiibacteriota bacterium]
VGLERQIHRHNAGLRTHILVSLGSCLIMLTSLYVFDIYSGKAQVDPSRIAAGVITGIGFLGAGAILRDTEGVKGLTTAASLWVVAGIGLAVGCGFNRAAIYATILALVVLFLLRFVDSLIISRDEKCRDKKGGG